MDQIPSSIMEYIALIIVAIVATLVQRKWGPKALWWVWLTSAAIITGATFAWIFYKHGLPSAPQSHEHLFTYAFLVIYSLGGIAIAPGGVIWFVAVLGPRPSQDSSTEVNYFPYDLPIEELKDTHGLAGILGQYHKLLVTFGTSLNAALGSTPFNPYLSPPRAFIKGFQMYNPNLVRQGKGSRNQFDRAPNALMRDLAGASTVLAELETLTAAQRSAIEECHRVNVRRLRRRTILGWPWGKVAVICTIGGTMITSAVAVAEKVAGAKPSDLWPFIKGNIFTWATLQSNLTLVLYVSVMVLIFLVINIWTFLPALRRVQAFEDILTIAKAYCHGDSGTTKPQLSQSPEP